LGYINIDGKLRELQDAAIPADNRTFRYGYGLFETMLVLDGVIQLADYHCDRLWSGAAALYLQIPKLLTHEALVQEVLRTVARNKLEKCCRVRLQLYLGSGGFFDDVSQQAHYLIECFPLEAHMTELNEMGLIIGIAEGLQKNPDALANYKTTNALLYAIAAQQAIANKWNDALLCNTHGHIIESTIANIFWIKDDKVYTPPLAEGCVAGVMRRYVMQKIAVTESILTTETLQQADAVFLTNAIRRIKWVRKFDTTIYNHGAVQNIVQQIF
jgi:branched-chain amino acid aminotransferase